MTEETNSVPGKLDGREVEAGIGTAFRADQAKPADADAVMRLLVRTAEWFRSLGSTQWQALLAGEDSHRTVEAISRGDVYVFRPQGEEAIAGMVMLLREPSAWDRELWGAEGHASAVYLHRLAIDRETAGRGLGGRIMRWVETDVRFPGKDRIRLDCLADNPVLNAFYAGLGYMYEGRAENANGSYSKYEKRLRS
ncbi:GNAT family N-acetyltransferase [Cohnella nanjingensis]|uniref:GNAT family N-acetyltransferase n=1 Tax=Cohnella nanjingensis TaxID=1387779 RepID=A0A7X0RS62_9BACL|nr:GNAT family N-acetyltransferase [Cohnella nanjingensis]MBB6672704.1 GNAT family N-acetyltransferase [Cohnella nanjingensis]